MARIGVPTERLRLSFRRAEQFLAARKREAAYALLSEIAAAPEDLGETATTYLLALQWVAAPPAAARELLVRLSARGAVAAIVLADVAGQLEMPFPLDLAKVPAAALLDGLQRIRAVLEEVGRIPSHIGWMVERAAEHLDEATEAQLLALAEIAASHHLLYCAWPATTRGIRMRGPLLPHFLLLRASDRDDGREDPRRVCAVIEAARAVALRANDQDAVARADAAALLLPVCLKRALTDAEIDDVIKAEENPPTPRRAQPPAPKPSRKPEPTTQRGLFEP